MSIERRQLIRYLVGVGVLGTVGGCALHRKIFRAMPEPTEMPDYMSVFEYVGSPRVNGEPANLETKIGAGDLVETDEGCEITFILAKDAFQLKPNSRIQLPEVMEGGTYVLHSGAALGVFAARTRHVSISTPDAIVSIRGTAVYSEVFKDRTYICTCYGKSVITSVHDASQSVSVVSTHHDSPQEFLRSANASQRLIEPATFKNHQDKSLSMIETLVGREMPVYP